MKQIQKVSYSFKEEMMNSITHGIGVIMGIVGLILLILKAVSTSRTDYLISAIIFGVSIILLYLASTLYHSFPWPRVKHIFKIMDHSAIYLLIAGSYTPFLLISVKGTLGYGLFMLMWLVSIAGIVFKIFFVGRFKMLSTLFYLGLGWMAILIIKPLFLNLSTGAFALVVAGGIVYTVGAIFYSVRKLPYNHTIWHLFVLGGTICHFLAVYLYVMR
jgi:hemolysin III